MPGEWESAAALVCEDRVHIQEATCLSTNCQDILFLFDCFCFWSIE